MTAALITGGTSGIGRATAELLHERGWQVAVTGRGAPRGPLPDGVLALAADARSLEDTEAAIATVKERFGALHLVFLNAGVSRPAPLGDVDEAQFDDQVAVNFRGQYFTLQRALPLLADGGAVVFTVGSGVAHGIPGGTLTAATRGALLALVPSLALELAPRGIRVNAVSPGAIDTPIWDGLPAEIREGVAAKVPFGRFGEPSEIAETVAFLASDGAAYITGQHIEVAGGSGLGA